ncbi:MAG: hypothetical protein IKX88_09185, partial [Thermoguttaceae bacterium]|nr:hypothetical protein [Thermoguttaceae bacterium]
CFHEITAAQPVKHRESCQDIFGRIMSQSTKNAPQAAPKKPVAVVDEEEKTETVDPDDDPFADENDAAPSANASSNEDDDPFGDNADSASSSSSSADEDDDPFGADSSDDEDPFGGDF